MNVTNVAAGLSRSNTQPLPSTEAKPQPPARANTAPASLPSPKPPHTEDTFTPAKADAPNAPKPSALGNVFEKGKALGGLGGGLFGIGTNIKGLVDDAKNGAGAHDFVNNALGLGKGVLGTVAGGLQTAATFEKGLKGAGTAVKVGAEAAGVAGKAAGRFVPGLNVGIAAADTAIAANTISNPKASLGDKITSGITAAGSIASATNIPIVSQVGAGVSLASTAVGTALHHTDFFKKIFG